MANNPTQLAIFTLTSGASAVVDKLIRDCDKLTLLYDVTYASTPTGQCSLELMDGYGGMYDPAITWPWNQPVPLAIALDGSHPCTSVAWDAKTTSYSFSSIRGNGQSVSIALDTKLTSDWLSSRIFNNSNVSCTIRIMATVC